MSTRPSTAPLLSWVRPHQWVVVDLLVALGYGAVSFVALANRASSAGGWVAAIIGALCLAAPLAGRRRAPLLSLVVLLATLEVMAVAAPSSMAMALPPVVLVLYSVAVESSLATSVVALAVSCACLFSSSLHDLLHPGGIVVAVPAYVAAWALGAVLGLHRRHLRIQLELQDRLRQAQVRRAELELVDQRVRIARELHDVVAHGISVITVQAGFAGLVADEADTVRPALRSIETAGRQTLDEMRTLLEVLRDGTDHHDEALAPAPGIDDLVALVARTRESGVDVVLTGQGDLSPLPALVELNAYRIVQESLTNVVKHARPASATVHLERDDRQLTITVRDDGQLSSDATVEPGHGITGMLERARILGGTLHAGPMSGGGYEVLGHLPLTSHAPALPIRAVDRA